MIFNFISIIKIIQLLLLSFTFHVLYLKLQLKNLL